MGLFIKASRRLGDKYEYAFVPSSLPSTQDEVVEGNELTGILDGNPE